MSHRTEQLESALRRGVSQVLSRGLNDPRVRGLVSVVSVKVSPDMTGATVNVSVAPAEHGKLTLHGLRHASRRIQAEVSNLIRIRRMPRLEFRLDDSLKRQSEVLGAIRQAMDETGPAPEASAETPGTPTSEPRR